MMDIHQLYQLYLQHPVVSTDSRQLTRGCIFFAIKGERFDGNAYALSAIELGAAYAVVDDPNLQAHPQLIYVENTLVALQELAALHRAKLSIPVVAITGTNGKTTTKELTASVLAKKFKVLATEGNLNNHIGVPLTLLRLRQEHQMAIIEMGASALGDIDELCQIAQPNYGVITNIGLAHLEGFGSIEGVEATKGELYDWLREHDGKVIRKEEDQRLARLAQGIPAVTYGQSSEAIVRGCVLDSDDLYLSLTWGAEPIKLAQRKQCTQLIGRYNIDNVLAAVAIGLFFDIDAELINQAIAEYIPVNNRSQLIRGERNTIIADAYNANPSSMRSAIDNFLAIKSEQPRLIILGDMNELGKQCIDAHQGLLDSLTEYRAQDGEVLLCGPIWSYIAPSSTTFADVESLSEYLKVVQPQGNLVLVKGSNSIRLSSILTLL